MTNAQLLSAEQVLLTTLVVKLAVMAALATMLVRYRRFRHILIFERRDWPDRLVFALALGIPLACGVAARLLLNYRAADLTLEGAFLAGLANERARAAYPALASWAKDTRLNPLGGIGRHRDDPKVIEARERIKRFGAAAAGNLAKLTRKLGSDPN